MAALRFDDTLETVLGGDLSTVFGMSSAWRQLVDLIGRRRVPSDPRALAVLRGIREEVPLGVRAASARGLEYADPPAALVRLLALDEVVVAAPVLAHARLSSAEWIQLLPELSPAGRSVLRNRRDLSPVVRRALDSFGPSDFVLHDETRPAPMASVVDLSPDVPHAATIVVVEEIVEAEFVPVADPTPPMPEVAAEAMPTAAESPVTPAAEPGVDAAAVAEAEPQVPAFAQDAPVPAVDSNSGAEALDSPPVATDVPLPLPSVETIVDWAGMLDARPAPPPEPDPVVPQTSAPVAPSDARMVLAEALAGLDAAVAGPEPVSIAVSAFAPTVSGLAEPIAEADEPTAGVNGAEDPGLGDSEPLAPASVAQDREGEAAEATEPEAVAAAPTPPAAASLPAEIASEAEGSTTADAIAVEEDFSFVALAESRLPTVAATAVAPTLVPVADQNGTVEATAGEPPIVSAEPVAHDPGMNEADVALAEPPAPFPATAVVGPEREAELQHETVAADPAAPVAGDVDETAPQEGPFEIAEVVARIDAFWRKQQDAPPAPPRPLRPADQFRFETDAKGVIRWVDGVSRAPIVGLSLDLQGVPGASSVDGVAAGAFRQRAGFSSARLLIEGDSDAAGDWLISGIPVFDPANGRFTGYRGTARRPRVDERAEPPREEAIGSPADSLRQLVHELRTPTNAIAGFAEMIETQMLGPVADPYRERAGVIRSQAKELLGAIDDLDLAARIDSAALALVPGRVPLRPLLSAIAEDLAPLAELRGSWMALPIDDLAVSGDRRAVERLLARLMATLVSASGPGERIGVRTALDGDTVTIAIERPRALADYPGDSVLGIDDEGSDATLLGTGFALRLARNLARELGGSMLIEPESLTLRLPASVIHSVEQAHLN